MIALWYPQNRFQSEACGYDTGGRHPDVKMSRQSRDGGNIRSAQQRFSSSPVPMACPGVTGHLCVRHGSKVTVNGTLNPNSEGLIRAYAAGVYYSSSWPVASFMQRTNSSNSEIHKRRNTGSCAAAAFSPANMAAYGTQLCH